MAIKASWLRLHVSEEKSFAAIDKRSIGMPIHLFIIIYQLWKSKLTWPSLIGFVHEEELLWRIKNKIDLTFLLKTAFNVSTQTKFGYLVNLLETSTVKIYASLTTYYLIFSQNHETLILLTVQCEHGYLEYWRNIISAHNLKWSMKNEYLHVRFAICFLRNWPIRVYEEIIDLIP